MNPYADDTYLQEFEGIEWADLRGVFGSSDKSEILSPESNKIPGRIVEPIVWRSSVTEKANRQNSSNRLIGTVSFRPSEYGSKFELMAVRHGGSDKKLKACRLDKDATNVLAQWMIQHQANPFPTTEEKMELAKATGLHYQQVGHWMTNMRKRRLYPITSGRKKPRTAFDHYLLVQHDRMLKSKSFRTDTLNTPAIDSSCHLLSVSKSVIDTLACNNGTLPDYCFSNSPTKGPGGREEGSDDTECSSNYGSHQLREDYHGRMFTPEKSCSYKPLEDDSIVSPFLLSCNSLNSASCAAHLVSGGDSGGANGHRSLKSESSGSISCPLLAYREGEDYHMMMMSDITNEQTV